MDSIDPSLPSVLVELVAQMLAKDPTRRPTMDEVAVTLGELLEQPLSPRGEPMLPEPSGLIEIDISGEHSGDGFLSRHSARSGGHLPLVDKPRASQPIKLPAGFPHSQTMSVPPPPAAEAPGWEDDHVTTSSIATAAPAFAPLPKAEAVRGPAPSDQSLPVGSQYDLRPVRRGRAWVSTLALLGVGLLVIGAKVFYFTPPRPGAARDRGAVASAPTVPPQTTSPSVTLPPPIVPVPKAKLKKNCQHMMPSAACVSSQLLTAPQKTALLAVFAHSEASLCAGDRMVVSGLPTAPRLQVPPKSMARKARANLLRELKELPGSLSLPAQLEVLCPDPE